METSSIPEHKLSLTTPIPYNEIKTLVREGLDEDQRPLLWPHLPRFREGETITKLENIDDIADNLFTVVSGGSTSNLMNLLSHTYTIKCPEVMDSFLRLISTVVVDKKRQFLMLCDLANDKDKYFPEDSHVQLRRMYVFRELLRRYMPATFHAMQSIHALDFPFLEHMFKNYFVDILPVSEVRRVMDSYLLEGNKILFRYGLALIKVYKRTIKSGHFKTGNEFWNKVIADAKFDSANEQWAQLNEFAFERGRNVFEKALRPMNIGRAQIKELLQGAVVKPDIDELIQEKAFLETIDVSNFACFQSIRSVSSIVDDNSCHYLVETCLPPTSQQTEFVLAFTTKRDGWNLSHLHRLLDGLNPCLVMIQSSTLSTKPFSMTDITNTSPTRAIVGFFVDDCISPPTGYVVRGNGATTTCFRLDNGHWQKLTWKGTNQTNTDMTMNQFVVSANDYISVGASKEFGSNAIRLFHDLRMCSTGPSDTFGNTHGLVTIEDDNSSSSNSNNVATTFQVHEIEVFVGSISYHKAISEGRMLKRPSIIDHE